MSSNFDLSRQAAPQQAGDVGILTFHCSDNFGAMLQAYALKNHLRSCGVRADIVPYAPPYMTGRHWRIPYVPNRRAGWLGFAKNMAYGFLRSLRAGREFTLQRANMARFRREYLLNPGQREIWFSSGLRRLPYRYYIVGSDQIWNPDITFGLRPEYFGGFQNRRKECVISYGASLGGSALPPQYDREFARLLQNLDAVSLRESGAVPYVQSLYPKEVTEVLDPVFFLGPEEWRKIERPPDRTGYILAYGTEINPDMTCYIQTLSQSAGLPVLELGYIPVAGGESAADRAAGPAEFLGYVRGADYVVTNSFHATAFSLIFQKSSLSLPIAT